MDDYGYGAKWLKCDLHVHSPLEPTRSFGENIQRAQDLHEEGDDSGYEQIAENVLENCRDENEGFLDLIALTDHNTIRGYEKLSPHFKDLRDENPEYPHVLPGVEISTASERTIHNLVIFEKDTDIGDIKELITLIFDGKNTLDEDNNPEPAPITPSDFLKKLKDYCHPPTGERDISFVVIPAHSHSSRGVEYCSRNHNAGNSLYDQMQGRIREMVIAREDWDGFEANKSFDELNQNFQKLIKKWLGAKKFGQSWDDLTDKQKKKIEGKDHWPIIETSDPHNYEEIGDSFTWLKMEKANLEGIRLALLDPESRLKRSEIGKPVGKGPKIRKLTVGNTDFIDEFSVKFNQSLNTIIGGRGTGKSTLIELLRYVLNRALEQDFEEHEQEIKENIEELLEEKEERDYGETSGILLPDHVVKAVIEIENSTYKIIREKENISAKKLEDGKYKNVEDIDVRTLLNPKIISQGQIVDISEDPEAQLREIDSLTLEDFEFQEQKSDLMIKLEQMQSNRKSKSEKYRTLEEKKTQLQKINDRLNLLEQQGKKQVIEKFSDMKEEEDSIKGSKQDIQDLKSSITDIKDKLGDLIVKYEELDDESKGEVYSELFQEVISALSITTENLESEESRLDELVGIIEDTYEGDWQDEFSTVKQEFQEIANEIDDPDFTLDKHEELINKKGVVETLTKIDI